MKIVISLLLSSLAVLISAYVVPGVEVSSFWSALLVAMVMGFLNLFVRPALLLLTLPINILTLGLFTFVISVFIVYLTSLLVPGFFVNRFWPALLFALMLALVNYFFRSR